MGTSHGREAGEEDDGDGRDPGDQAQPRELVDEKQYLETDDDEEDRVEDDVDHLPEPIQVLDRQRRHAPSPPLVADDYARHHHGEWTRDTQGQGDRVAGAHESQRDDDLDREVVDRLEDSVADPAEGEAEDESADRLPHEEKQEHARQANRCGCRSRS